MPSIVKTSLPALPANARLLKREHLEASNLMNVSSPAQDNASYDVDGDGKTDIFEVTSPTQRVRVVIDRQARTREELWATNLSQFGQQPDPINRYIKESFAGGYDLFIESLNEGKVASLHQRIDGLNLVTNRSDGTTTTYAHGANSAKDFERGLEDVELSPGIGFSVGR